MSSSHLDRMDQAAKVEVRTSHALLFHAAQSAIKFAAVGSEDYDQMRRIAQEVVQNATDDYSVGACVAGEVVRFAREQAAEAAKPKSPERMTATASAKLLRKRLREAFPGTKFSATLSRGTAYGSLDVSWEGGPTSEEVAVVTSNFEGEGFDAMTDSTIHYPALIQDDAGTTYRSGLRLILLHRRNA